jgi:hypothetical protein
VVAAAVVCACVAASDLVAALDGAVEEASPPQPETEIATVAVSKAAMTQRIGFFIIHILLNSLRDKRFCSM